jgi:peptidoglycan hydrolase CwlO-like protein
MHTGITTRPSRRQGQQRSIRWVIVAACMMLVGVAGPGQAQTSDELESIRDERREAQDDAAEQAGKVDATNSEVGELTEALAVLQKQVNAAQDRVNGAERSLEDAELRQVQAEEAVLDQRFEIDGLNARLAERAISSFVNQGNAASVIIESSDPNEAVRMQALVKDVTQGEVDVAEQLRGAEEDLRIQEALAESAADEAAGYRDDMQIEFGLLDEARGAQASLTADAESRLDRELGELAAIERFDAELADEEQDEIDRLAEELRKKNPPPSPATVGGGDGGGSRSTGPIGSDEIVSVRGIQVHISIADQVDRLLGDAAASGIALSGGGYRSSDSQIAVRRANCGTSNYAIWEMPASQCRPPTARPGRSQHEQGLALDVTYNGALIRSRSNAGYQWLAANAANYGFKNLPSEPWHWSTTGS